LLSCTGRELHHVRASDESSQRQMEKTLNLIRTIPQYETRKWLDLLFQPKTPETAKDCDPLTYPFPVQFREDVSGGYLYVRYRGDIIGYAKIADVQHHTGDAVGAERNPVGSGDRVLLEAPLSPMPRPTLYPGGFRWKYEPDNLHEKAL